MAVLSIVSPIFNSADYLGQLLDSVDPLSTPHEHIVVDGGSTDGTVELLRARDRPDRTWVSERDRGQTHAVNKGLAKATGDYVNWINGDNAYLPERIDAAVAFLDEHPEVDAIFGGFDFIDEHGAFRRRYVPSEWSWREYLYRGDHIPTETIVFRRALLEQAPWLDERFADAADFDFYLRLLHRRRVVRIPQPLILYRFHPGSKTGRDPWLAQSEHRAIRAQWAVNRRQRVLMEGVDAVKRTVLPRISSWPRPY